MEDSELNMMEENPVVKVPPTTFRNSVWPSMKPFVNGGLALVLPMSSAYFLASLCYRLNSTMAKSWGSEFIHRNWHYVSQRMPFLLFRGGINMATLLGSYELLTRKVEALNEGSPLTLYQEAGCGIASGAIQACICYPLTGLLGRGISHAASFRCIFSTITQVVRNEGVLALWKGAFPVGTPAVIAYSTGLLVSYDRCQINLKDTYGLSQNHARLGAGIFSGLCSGACYISVSYAAGGIICSMRVKSPIKFLLYALKVLRSSNFYSQLVKRAVYNSPSVTILWVSLEMIRDFEESIGL